MPHCRESELRASLVSLLSLLSFTPLCTAAAKFCVDQLGRTTNGYSYVWLLYILPCTGVKGVGASSGWYLWLLPLTDIAWLTPLTDSLWLLPLTADFRAFPWFYKDSAAGNGCLSVVKWLHSNRNEGCTVSAMNWAAAEGHLDVVKWLHRNRRVTVGTLRCREAAASKQASRYCNTWMLLRGFFWIGEGYIASLTVYIYVTKCLHHNRRAVTAALCLMIYLVLIAKWLHRNRRAGESWLQVSL